MNLRVFREILILTVLSLVAAFVTWAFHPHAPEWTRDQPEKGAVTISAVGQFPGEVIFIDSRTEEAYHSGHLPGAIWVSEDDFEMGFSQLIERWSPDSLLVVYCDGGGCHASRAVANRLKDDLGTENVYWLEGGILSWEGELETE